MKKDNPMLSVRRRVPMNTGERVHKSVKDYRRSDNKVDLRKVDLYYNDHK